METMETMKTRTPEYVQTAAADCGPECLLISFYLSTPLAPDLLVFDIPGRCFASTFSPPPRGYTPSGLVPRGLTLILTF